MKTIAPMGHSIPPAPPSPEVVARASVPLIRFHFLRRYSGLYSNRHERFVLREEHIAELKRLVSEHNAERVGRSDRLSMSSIINSALDFAFEHPLAFHPDVAPEHLPEALGREVYQKALLHFVRHAML